MAEADASTAPVAGANAGRRWLVLVVGIVVSAVALGFTVRRVAWGEVQGVLAGVAWGWLPIMAALKLASLWLKDVRWAIELEAMGAARPYRRSFRAVALGYYGNVMLPFRIGELMRVGLFRRWNPAIDVGGALATVAAERALDGAVLALMVAAALPFADVPRGLFEGAILLLVSMLAIVAVAMATPLHDLAMRLLPSRGPLRVGRAVIAALSRGTAVLRRPRHLALAALTTALGWLAEGLVIWAAARALDLPLGLASSLVVTLLLSIALLVPSAPGQLGTHQYMTEAIVVPFGVAAPAAVGLSLVIQAVSLTVLGALGGLVLLGESTARRAGAVPPSAPRD